MPRVSHYRLSKQVEQEIQEILPELFIRITERDIAQKIIDDLFTPTEKIMLAKRILTAVYLQEGQNYKEIVNTLKVTPSMINGVKVVLVRSGVGLKALHGLLTEKRKELAEKFQREEKNEEQIRKIDHALNIIQLPVKGSKSDMKRWKRAIGA